jgi:molybdopterin converting factor small subunit
MANVGNRIRRMGGCRRNGGRWIVKVGFFGRLREALGDEREVPAESGETVARLRIRLAGLHPGAARDLLSPRVRACVGDEMVGEDFLLGGQERVEFLPPLSGG